MSISALQHVSLIGVSWLRRLLSSIRRWVQARPRVSAWIYPRDDRTAEECYREFNLRYFADFHEHERMLADHPRMEFYRAAISRHIRPGNRVVDLGTGTGILAAMAARRGAAIVYAIDHSDILDHARELARANGVKQVEFIGTHSTAFQVAEPVDVILHEQMGDCLFDESMLTNVTDLRDRLLKPGGLILPSQFEFYCEPVTVTEGRQVPFLWELNVHGYDFSCLERHRPQDPPYYRLVSSDPTVIDQFLTVPAPALTIDLQTVIETEMTHEIHLRRPVVNAGRLDGLVVYFCARVDDDLHLSSGPLDPERAPHWGFRILRTEQENFSVGDVIDVRLKVGRWPELDSWRWTVVKCAPACQDQDPEPDRMSSRPAPAGQAD